MVMYQGQKNELKRYILGTKSAHDISINKVHKNFEVLSEDLSEKKDTINKSRNEIKCAEEILDFIESKKITSVACYKNLLGDLKKDLLKIESEVKELQNEIKELSKRRDDLKHDILQQQEKPYICTKELDFNVISNQNSFDDYKLKIN
ncbi:hypothetical protein KQX54_015407 [Cotesia glomerata]|uniref:Uncharacterized protein n=1 Tax=Cotesia glomerata TaxID=32391 RepID=A0AAV7I7K7_COTGL|nr:hypothetical protein KQX54_015407 [Cotesia glomerata]